MSSWLETRLFRATARTFEDLGFILPTWELSKEQRAIRAGSTVEVCFEGTFSGRLVLTVFGPVLTEIAGNMLGEDPSEISVATAQDTLGELANIICGNVLPAIAGDRETFALHPPAAMREIPLLEAPDGGIVGEVQVGVDDGRADVRLYLAGELPAEARAEAA
jgi:CheY-specific phosphatase CheX